MGGVPPGHVRDRGGAGTCHALYNSGTDVYGCTDDWCAKLPSDYEIFARPFRLNQERAPASQAYDSSRPIPEKS